MKVTSLAYQFMCTNNKTHLFIIHENANKLANFSSPAQFPHQIGKSLNKKLSYKSWTKTEKLFLFFSPSFFFLTLVVKQWRGSFRTKCANKHSGKKILFIESYVRPPVLAKNKPIEYDQIGVWHVKFFGRDQLQIFHSKSVALPIKQCKH